jgi:hypothetical protein
VPHLSARELEGVLSALRPGPTDRYPFRIIRTEGPYALVAVPHTTLAEVRAAWNAPASQHQRFGLRTIRTYGTLRKGKLWIAHRRPEPPESP